METGIPGSCVAGPESRASDWRQARPSVASPVGSFETVRRVQDDEPTRTGFVRASSCVPQEPRHLCEVA